MTLRVPQIYHQTGHGHASSRSEPARRGRIPKALVACDCFDARWNRDHAQSGWPSSSGKGWNDMRSLLALVLAIALSGCVQQEATLSTSMNQSEMAWAVGDGTNTVAGFAVLRTVGGEARTCAGLAVNLIPDSPYARERMTAIFGNTVKGTRDTNLGPVKFSGSDDPLYIGLLRTTRCDGQGAFTFDRVPNGVWFATTSVTWKANPRSPLSEGGSMMQRVELRGGQTVKVTLP